MPAGVTSDNGLFGSEGGLIAGEGPGRGTGTLRF